MELVEGSWTTLDRGCLAVSLPLLAVMGPAFDWPCGEAVLKSRPAAMSNIIIAPRRGRLESLVLDILFVSRYKNQKAVQHSITSRGYRILFTRLSASSVDSYSNGLAFGFFFFFENISPHHMLFHYHRSSPIDTKLWWTVRENCTACNTELRSHKKCEKSQTRETTGQREIYRRREQLGDGAVNLLIESKDK